MYLCMNVDFSMSFSHKLHQNCMPMCWEMWEAWKFTMISFNGFYFHIRYPYSRQMIVVIPTVYTKHSMHFALNTECTVLSMQFTSFLIFICFIFHLRIHLVSYFRLFFIFILRWITLYFSPLSDLMLFSIYLHLQSSV